MHKKFLTILALLLLIQPITVYAAMPTSTNFKLQEYSLGSGGTQNSTSTTFGLFGTAGEVEFGQISSTNFKTRNGLIYLQTSNLPPAPTITNAANYYNKLSIIVANGNNPSDTTFAIAVSPDNFVSTTKYVQADSTLGTSPVWQTYTQWGGASGVTIIGLNSGATYTAKVAAKQGKFTQTGFGPTAQAATIKPTLSFSLSTNALNIGQLTPQTVVTSPSQVTVTVSTNGTGGATIYGYGTNNGLLSSSTNYTISSGNADLSAATEGYGLQATSTTQSSGGPMETLSPYNGTGNNVGVLDTNKRILFDSSNQPVTTGQGVFALKAKASATARAAGDYADTLTIIASATF